MEQFIVVHRKNGDLACQTKFYGPFADFGEAYDHLCSLPAVGVYDEAEHQGQHGCKYVQELEAVA